MFSLLLSLILGVVKGVEMLGENGIWKGLLDFFSSGSFKSL